MRLKLFLLLILTCMGNIYGFSIWADGYKWYPLRGNINTIYVMNDCLINDINADVIRYCATTFSPDSYILGAPKIVPNVVIVNSEPIPQPNNTIIIKKDSINSDWAMCCTEIDLSNSKFKVYFNTTVPSSNFTKAKLLHEFGHGIGLGHTNKASHVMQDDNSQISFLKEDEIQGLYSQYAPPEFVSEEPIAISKGKNKVKLSFKPASKIINQSNDYKIELYYDDGNINNTEKIDNELPISFTDVTDYYWEFNAPANCKYRLKSYVYLTEDCKGKSAANNISNRDEPVKIIETKLFELIPADSAKLLKGDKTGVEVHKPKTTEPKSVATYTLSIDGTEVQQLFFAGDTLATFNWNTTDLNPGEHILKVLEKSGITKESRTVDSSMVKLYKPVILSPTPDDWCAQKDTIYFLPGAICQNDTLTLDSFKIKNLKADYSITGAVTASGSSNTGQRIWGWRGWVYGQMTPAPGTYTVNLNLSCNDTTYTPVSSQFFVSALYVSSPEENENVFAMPGKIDTLRYWMTYRSDHKYPKISVRNSYTGLEYTIQSEPISQTEYPNNNTVVFSFLWDQSNITGSNAGSQPIELYFPKKRVEQKRTFHSRHVRFYYPYFFDDFSRDRGWSGMFGIYCGGIPCKAVGNNFFFPNVHENYSNKSWARFNGVYNAEMKTDGIVDHYFNYPISSEIFALNSSPITPLHYLDAANHAYIYFKYKMVYEYPDNTNFINVSTTVSNLDIYGNTKNTTEVKSLITKSLPDGWYEAIGLIDPEVGNSDYGSMFVSILGTAHYDSDDSLANRADLYLDDVGIFIDRDRIPFQTGYTIPPANQLIGHTTTINWGGGGKVFSKNQPSSYNVYRDSVLIENVFETSFTDSSAVIGREYVYGISAVYPDGVVTDPRACTIFASRPDVNSNRWVENFDNDSLIGRFTLLPIGWNCDLWGSRTAYWQTKREVIGSDPTGNYVVCFNVGNSYIGDTTRMFTRPYNLSNNLNPALQFNMQHSTLDPANNDYIQLQVYTKANGWQNIGTPYYRYNGSNDWATYQIDLSSYAGLDYLLVGFVGVNRGGQNIYLDNIEIKTSDSPNMMISGTHNINSDLIIPENKTLILQPDTKLLFAQGVGLQVNGKMVADGSLGKITLSSQEPGTSWQGIYGNRSNSISLKNVMIENTLTGVSRFDSVAINNCQFINSEDAVYLYQPLSVEIKNSKFENCVHGIEVNIDDKSINCPVTIEQDTLVNIDTKYKTGINIFNAGTMQSIIKNNVITNFNIGIGLAYGNALCQNNDITGGEYGMQLFESSPVLLNNRIYNNDYGFYTIGYAAPVLNPFASANGYGGYNRINDNNLNQLYYDQNSQIRLDSGRNDIYSSSIDNQLVYKFNNQVRTIWARANYWGSDFNPNKPSIYFEPWSNFYFAPYSTTPNISGDNNKELPEDGELEVFDLALKKEVTRDNSAAGVLFAELLNQLPENAAEILPRVEYNGNQGKRSTVYESLHDQKLITDFTYYSFLAREAFHNGNEQSAADFYNLKLDSSEINNDSLIAKINLLDLYWSVNQKGKVKLSRQLKDLVCKDAKEYAAKREKLLAELLGTPTGIATDNTVKDFSLFQNYPNPFNPATSIKYALPEAGNVKIKIYNLAGALVSEINEGTRKTGYHTTHFNGNQLASGVYIYLLEFNGSVMMTKKMVMLK